MRTILAVVVAAGLSCAPSPRPFVPVVAPPLEVAPPAMAAPVVTAAPAAGLPEARSSTASPAVQTPPPSPVRVQTPPPSSAPAPEAPPASAPQLPSFDTAMNSVLAQGYPGG